MFGADRFYLGYPAIGLLKFATLGGCFVFQLIDILLIAMQLLRPADNSNYVMKYFGPRLTIVRNSDDFSKISEEFVEYMATSFY
jgi:TM2 domain-containing membrane protein YozV